MTLYGWLQAIAVFLLVLACVKPLGAYMARVFSGERTFLSPLLVPLERAAYSLCRIDPEAEMSWQTYLFAMFAFSAVGLIYLYVLLRTQASLPLNPQKFGNFAPDLAWNTAVSFLTNTNWQFYSGESTMSYLSQMAGLAWHNFVSAAVGISLAIAVIRGFARTSLRTLGNFWVDLVRCCLYVLLPLSFLGALLLLSQGVQQNFNAYPDAVGIEGATYSIPGGPMASQEVIKELGTNGGGFVGANSASTFENPTPFSNLFELFLILLIPAALTYTFGRMVKNQRQGWALFATMALVLGAGVVASYVFQSIPNPIMAKLGVVSNMEGIETRFGIAASTLFATITTVTSCGAVNAMHDSFMPLAGLVPLVNIQLGEVIFGGVGSGLYGMLVFVVLTVFIAGLMVGRTPEYLGKKIERREVVFAILAIVMVPVFSLVPTAIAAVVPAGLATLGNAGPHGFSEILYAFSSSTGNNGSAFGGLGPNLFYNVATGISMLGGRFLMIVPALALAGSLAGKRSVSVSSGTFTTDSPIFVLLLIGVIVIVGALTFLPADALGPIVEQLLMQQGKLF